MKITICGSIAFIDEMLEAKKKLEALGHEVKMPLTEVTTGDGEVIPSSEYYKIRREGSNDPWVWDVKEMAIKKHFIKVEWCDAILVLNHDKNGVKGYVGANTLMEMGLALHLGKKIFMINQVPELPYKEEILGLKPIIINDFSYIN